MLQQSAIYVYFPARDMARARQFYEAKMGLAPQQEINGGVVFEDYDMPGERSPSGAVTAGGAKAAWFKDSEGNILALVQNLEA